MGSGTSGSSGGGGFISSNKRGSVSTLHTVLEEEHVISPSTPSAFASDEHHIRDSPSRTPVAVLAAATSSVALTSAATSAAVDLCRFCNGVMPRADSLEGAHALTCPRYDPTYIPPANLPRFVPTFIVFFPFQFFFFSSSHLCKSSDEILSIAQ